MGCSQPSALAASGATEGVRVFDNYASDIARAWRENFYPHSRSTTRLPFMGSPHVIDLAERTHMCVHVSHSDYPTAAFHRTRWRRRIDSGAVSSEALAPFAALGSHPLSMAERLAKHERFWKAPYHWAALDNGDILANNDPSSHIFHGGGAEHFCLTYAIEARVPALERLRTPAHSVLTEQLLSTARAGLRHAITSGRRGGAPLTHLTAHRAFSMKRAGEPGEAIWKLVVLPVAAELGLHIDYDLVLGGRPLPREWDPGSRYDYLGRSL